MFKIDHVDSCPDARFVVWIYLQSDRNCGVAIHRTCLATIKLCQFAGDLFILDIARGHTILRDERLKPFLPELRDIPQGYLRVAKGLSAGEMVGGWGIQSVYQAMTRDRHFLWYLVADAGDYDNDGDADLYVTNWGRNALLRNDGAGRFTDVTEAAGVGDPGWSTAAAFTDLDADGDLDLFVVNYLRWSIATAKSCYALNVRTYCGPLADDAAPDRLYRNDGDGTFTDVTATAGLAASHGSGLGIVSADFDGDGRFDVFVANDGMPNRLWVNKGDLRFDDEALLRGCAMDDHGLAKAGMGVAAGDVDDDGDQDLLVVNLVDQSDSFYRNLGTHFADHSSRVGLAVATRRYTRFGVVLADFDNDGDLDLYQANGRVKHDPEHAAPDVFAEPNVLFEYDAGFMPVPGPVSSPEPLVHTSRATTAGDLDNDGGMDLVVINRDARAYVLMNRASRGANWVRFRVLDASGRDAHGAVVSARVGGQRRWRSVQPAASYLSSNDPRVHFGLGSEPGVSGVQVRWPTGETGAYGDFDAGSTHVLRFGSAHGQ